MTIKVDLRCPHCNSVDVEWLSTIQEDVRIPANIVGCWECGKEFKCEQLKQSNKSRRDG